jgi:hypothetical protein
VELGKSEEWFWTVEPKILFVMLGEKRRLELSKMKTLAYLNQGGTIDEEEEELPGKDRPATAEELAWLHRS